MIRRRRPVRDIHFSFDSFLDVVANVVGIIIRLILVVWVGARSYSSVQHLALNHKAAPPPEAPATLSAPLGELRDPLQEELARHHQALDEAQARLLEQLRRLEQVEGDYQQVDTELKQAVAREQGLAAEGSALERTAAENGRTEQKAVLTLAELRERREHLQKEIDELEKLPPPKKTLRYRTPVSQPVHAEEFLFECRHGRVSFIDIGALAADMQGRAQQTRQDLQTQWQVTESTDPVGAFRLRFTVERVRDTLEAVVPGAAPSPGGSFRASLREWTVEPVADARGESLAQALAGGSDFRRVVDGLDAHQAVVTFFVYPDSFGLYRQLRDWLYGRDLIVAGRPLPDGVPITFSPRGTVSRGQ
jgi:hypothetical protein